MRSLPFSCTGDPKWEENATLKEKGPIVQRLETMSPQSKENVGKWHQCPTVILAGVQAIAANAPKLLSPMLETTEL